MSTEKKISKYYPTCKRIYGLRLYASEEIVTIKVLQTREPDGTFQGYCLRFEEIKNQRRIMILEDLAGRELASEKLEKSGEDLLLNAAYHFKQILLKFHKKIKHLSLLGPAFFGKFRKYDFGVEEMKKVESLCLESSLKVSKYLAKCPKVLKDLYISQEDTSKNLDYVKEIY